MNSFVKLLLIVIIVYSYFRSLEACYYLLRGYGAKFFVKSKVWPLGYSHSIKNGRRGYDFVQKPSLFNRLSILWVILISGGVGTFVLIRFVL